MPRQLLLAVTAACLLAVLSAPALAITTLTVNGVKVVDKWIIDQTDMNLREAPKQISELPGFGFLEDQEAFAKLWKAWRTGDAPKVDFTKHVVLVLTAQENARVDFTAALNDKGNLGFMFLTTERSPNGMTYVIAVIERAGIKSIGKVPLKPAK